jgi:hypothetical protein
MCVSATFARTSGHLHTHKHSLSGRLIVQCAENRCLQAKDSLAAWSDASSVADTHQKDREELLNINCWCSEEESASATHVFNLSPSCNVPCFRHIEDRWKYGTRMSDVRLKELKAGSSTRVSWRQPPRQHQCCRG